MSTVTVAEPSDAPSALELKEIPGPSAFEGDRHRFWTLLWLTALYEYRRQYMNSVFGYVWALLKPLLLFAILALVFTRVIRFGGSVENYAGMLLVGIMFFQFFTDGTDRTVRSLVASQHVIRKMRFPRMVIPLSVVLSACMIAVGNFVAVFVLLLAMGVDPQVTWLLAPVILLGILVFVIGLSLLLSSAFVYFQDVVPIWSVITRALFYLSPILYPIEFIPEDWRPLAYLNPLVPLLTQARAWITDPSADNMFEAAGSPLWVLLPLGVVAITCWIGFRRFRKVAVRVAEDL